MKSSNESVGFKELLSMEEIQDGSEDSSLEYRLDDKFEEMSLKKYPFLEETLAVSTEIEPTKEYSN
jgi:hypothetical protein